MFQIILYHTFGTDNSDNINKYSKQNNFIYIEFTTIDISIQNLNNLISHILELITTTQVFQTP